MESRKYSRTYHFPFSPGTTSDDRINSDWKTILDKQLVMTEKLDGENNCLKASGVYARSHAAPTINPWAKNMQDVWQKVKNDLNDLEFFGENLYGIHSIEYEKIEHYYYVFAIRDGDVWLGWEEVCFYANALDLPTVPVIEKGIFTEAKVKKSIDENLKKGSRLGGECEGFVFRNANAFLVNDFKNNVLKYVRKNHVKTDQHWTRNWKRAKLWFENAR